MIIKIQQKDFFYTAYLISSKFKYFQKSKNSENQKTLKYEISSPEQYLLHLL